MKNIIKLSLFMPFEEFKKEKKELDSFLCSVSKILEKNYCTKIYLYFSSTERVKKNNELDWADTAKNLIDKKFQTFGNKADNSEKFFSDWETVSELFDDVRSDAVKASHETDQSDICLFLFGSSLGENGAALFDYATKTCISNKGKSKIFSYFKNTQKSAIDKELTDFKENAILSGGFFCGNFDHIDTVKFRILLYIYTLYADFIDFNISYGQCMIDDIPVLSVENVAEFANNSEFISLIKQFRAHENKYNRIKNAYDRFYDNDEISEEYFSVTKEKLRLLYKLDALQKKIFDLCLEISIATSSGYITEQKKLALNHLEQGRTEACRNLLNKNSAEKAKVEKHSVFNRLIRRKNTAEENAGVNTEELRLTVNALKKLTHNTKYTELISEAYENICLAAFDTGACIGTVHEYVDFLLENNDSEKALIVARMIADFYSAKNISLIDKININMLLAKLYTEDNDMHSAAVSYIAAIQSIKAATEENMGVVIPRFDPFLKEMEEFFRKQENSGIKKDYLLHAISIKAPGEKNYPGKFLLSLASDYYDLGQLYFFYEENNELAETNYLIALSLYEDSANKTSKPDNSEFVSRYRSLGNFYQKQDRLYDAKKYYLKALELYVKLDESKHDPLDSSLAAIHSELADIYEKLNDTDNAEASYLNAIKLYEFITELPANEHFLPVLAGQHYKLGNLFEANQQFETAHENYDTAICVYLAAEKDCPGFSAANIAGVYEKKGDSFIIRYEAAVDSDINSQEAYKSAISAYFESLKYLNEALLNKHIKKEFQARVFNKIAEIYEKLSMNSDAEKNYLEAIACYNMLSEKTPDKYNESLLRTCFRLAELYFLYKNSGEAKTYYEKTLSVYNKIKSPSDSITEIGGICYAALGIIETNQQDFKKAEESFYHSEKICLELINKGVDSAKAVLAKAYNGMSILFSQQNKACESLEYSIKKRVITGTSTKSNTREFNIQLACDYTSVGVYYCDQTVIFKRPECFNIADEYINKAICLFNELSDFPLKENNKSFALAHRKSAELYITVAQHDKVRNNYEKAITIYNDLVENCSVGFRKELAEVYFNTGIVCEELKDTSQAEFCYLKSLDTYEAILLDTNNTNDYSLSLIMVYDRLAYLYDTNGNWQDAEIYYIKAITLEENIAKNDEDYREILLYSYTDIVDFYEKYPCDKAKSKRFKFMQKQKFLEIVIKDRKRIHQKYKQH